ncbi:MAG TPA: DUF4279 domain-containing protein [Steroidobacteraceae bacterium]|nr:DUF4279 domain-containing protein [Steroidobacteraceae bacterium]
MSVYEFTISLRVRHPSVDPVEITRTLGIEPLHTWRVGEPRVGPAGEPLDGVYRESYWMARLMDEPELSSGLVSVESVLLRTLAQLRRSLQFLAELNSDGGVAEVHVSIFARGDFRLDFLAESLALLGKLGLALTLDVQPAPGPEAGESLS